MRNKIRILSLNEVNNASVAVPKGARIGMVDGMATGMSVNGKQDETDGWDRGALSQPVGIVVSAVMGGVSGLVSYIISGY